MKAPSMILALLAGSSCFSASIESNLAWPALPSNGKPAGSDSTTGSGLSYSASNDHGLSVYKRKAHWDPKGGISPMWYLSEEQIQELELTGILDLLREHINPDYDFRKVTQEQLNSDFHRIEEILAGVPEPGSAAAVTGGLLAVMWLARHQTLRRKR